MRLVVQNYPRAIGLLYQAELEPESDDPRWHCHWIHPATGKATRAHFEIATQAEDLRRSSAKPNEGPFVVRHHGGRRHRRPTGVASRRFQAASLDGSVQT